MFELSEGGLSENGDLISVKADGNVYENARFVHSNVLNKKENTCLTQMSPFSLIVDFASTSVLLSRLSRPAQRKFAPCPGKKEKRPLAVRETASRCQRYGFSL